MSFLVNHGTPTLFGVGTAQQVGEELKKRGCTRVMLCCDPGIKKAGLCDKVLGYIRDAGLEAIEYSQVLPEPTASSVNAAGEFARANNIDGLVGLGGGSSMDTAKGCLIMLSNPGTIFDYIEENRFREKAFSYPLITIPTTSGTSSEVGPRMAVTNDRTGVKTFSPVRATLAIVDPEMVRGLPPFVTATTGLDMLAHTVESYFNPNEHWMSDYMDEKTIELVFKYLVRAVKDGNDMEARTWMSFACLNTGYAFGDNGTYMGHAIAVSLQAYCHNINHGLSTTFTIPITLRYFSTVFPEKIDRFAKAAGIELPEGLSAEEKGDFVAAAARKLCRDAGLGNMKSYGVTPEQWESMMALAPTNHRFATNSFKVDFDRMRKLMEEEYDA